jgi:septal ring-binding cell division protein DamX
MIDTGPDSRDTRTPPDIDATREALHAWLAERGMDPYAFTEQDIRQIHRVSGGDPGRIAMLAQQKFEDPALMQPPRGPGTTWKRVLGWGAFAVAAWLSWVWLYPLSRPPPHTIPVAIPPPIKKPAGLKAAVEQARPQAGATIPGVRTAAWLAGEDGGHYVLQLIGARDVHTLQDYIRRAGIPQRKLTLVNSVKGGRPWHILIYGVYEDPAAARDDSGRLPPLARRLKPWPRTVEAVRGEAVPALAPAREITSPK